jgi:hypothetical protein
MDDIKTAMAVDDNPTGGSRLAAHGQQPFEVANLPARNHLKYLSDESPLELNPCK